jgi:glycosyltransferase involved in cell wall biosynthesis
VSDTLVFVPAWNEEENLPAVLDGLHAQLPEADVLVVDDGSTDATAGVARAHGAEVLGTAVLRRSMGLVLGRSFGDATSGMYAVNAKALSLLAEPFTSGAPEVEALIRVADAGLRLEEVPVNMAERAGGESKLRGRKAVALVVTVAGTLALAWLGRRRRR